MRDQNALSEEIVNAITGNTLGDPIDDEELEAELDELQQEQLDEQMLKTGTVPVSDVVHKMPTVADSERKFEMCQDCSLWLGNSSANMPHSPQQETSHRGRRRGGRVQEAAGRDGHVKRETQILVALKTRRAARKKDACWIGSVSQYSRPNTERRGALSGIILVASYSHVLLLPVSGFLAGVRRVAVLHPHAWKGGSILLI